VDDRLKGDPLPADQHVLRLCRRGDLQWEADGSISGVFPEAFHPDSDGLSVTWVEWFGGEWKDQLVAARAAIARGRKIRVSNRLAVLDVNQVLAVGPQCNKLIEVIHDPDDTPGKENLGHSLVTGYVDTDKEVMNLLTTACISLE
jgi:hypothetical protein